MAKIAWIGLGNMGQPMTKRLLDAGHSLVVSDLVQEKAAVAVRSGARFVDTPAKAADEAVDFIFTMIPDSNVLKTVCIGPGGIIESLKPGTIVVDMSTVSADASAEVNVQIEAKGARFLRAPVTGSIDQAALGTLTVLCSGDRAAYDKTLDIFKVLTQAQFHMGVAEEARYMKLTLNMMVGTTCQMLAEAVAFGQRAGLDWKQMLEVIANSSVASPVVKLKTKTLADRDFNPAFTIKLMEKDFDVALEQAKKMDVSLPIVGLTRQFLAAARATGKGELDYSALTLVMEELSGIKRNN